jgi:predicted neutral ceramidase superfamily lipid hydrolase
MVAMSIETLKKIEWNKISKTVLYIQAMVATFLTIGMITGKIAPADIEPINGRKVAAFALAFAATLVLVARQSKNDIRWLLIPIFVTGFNLVDTLFEFGVRGDHINLMPPMIIEPIFFLIYIVCYIKLHGQSSTNA